MFIFQKFKTNIRFFLNSTTNNYDTQIINNRFFPNQMSEKLENIVFFQKTIIQCTTGVYLKKSVNNNYSQINICFKYRYYSKLNANLIVFKE